jgi:hypothetical protein
VAVAAAPPQEGKEVEAEEEEGEASYGDDAYSDSEASPAKAQPLGKPGEGLPCDLQSHLQHRRHAACESPPLPALPCAGAHTQ